MKFLRRKKARETTLQIIYSWNILKKKNIQYKIQEIKLLDVTLFTNIDWNYFKKITYGIIKNYKYINNIIKENLNKNTKYLNKIEQIILSIAIYEFKMNNYIPYKVIINESIELAKKFSHKFSHKLINSFLDKIYKNKKYN